MKAPLVALFVAFTSSLAAQTGNEPRNVAQLYGQQGLQTIRHPDSVSVALLNDRNGRLSERSRQILLPPDAQQTASKLLLENASYDWNTWKPCLPEYGARLIFRRGAQSVTLDFCFKCLILSVKPAPRSENEGNFDPSRSARLRLFKEQFPKDKVFKALQ